MGNFPPEVRERLLSQPAAETPPGVQSNLINPSSISNAATIDNTTCYGIALIAFLIYTFTKVRLMKRYELEDYILLLAQCLFTAFIGICYLVIDRGLFHQWDVRVRDMEFYLYYMRIIAALFGTTTSLIKSTILLQYLRLFDAKQSKGFIYWACHSVLWLNVVFYTVVVMIEAFPCTPLRKAWDPFAIFFKDPKCVNLHHHRLATAVVNVFSDFAILLIPQRAIWKLNMSLNRKLGISALFAVGLLACSTSLMRLYYCVEALQTPLTGDQLRTVTNYGMWLAPETACGILVATLPVFPRFYQFITGRDTGPLSSPSTSTITTQKSGSPTKLEPRPSLGSDLDVRLMYHRQIAEPTQPQNSVHTLAYKTACASRGWYLPELEVVTVPPPGGPYQTQRR